MYTHTQTHIHTYISSGVRQTLRACTEPRVLHTVGALTIRIGFEVYYTIIITRNPQNPIVINKAPPLHACILRGRRLARAEMDEPEGCYQSDEACNGPTLGPGGADNFESWGFWGIPASISDCFFARRIDSVLAGDVSLELQVML